MEKLKQFTPFWIDCGITSNGKLEAAVKLIITKKLYAAHVKVGVLGTGKCTSISIDYKATPFNDIEAHETVFWFAPKTTKSRHLITIYVCHLSDYIEIGQIDLKTNTWFVKFEFEIVGNK